MKPKIAAILVIGVLSLSIVATAVAATSIYVVVLTFDVENESS